MGMFDNINVSTNAINLPLPKDGRYQTKWLDSNLCEIQLKADGRLTCPDFKGCDMYPVEVMEDLDCGSYNDEEFHFHGDDINGKWHEFTAVVKDSRIVKLWSYGDLLFDDDADDSFDDLPSDWDSNQTLSGVRLTSLTLVRYRMLKGGRRIIQGYRNVAGSAAIVPDSDGLFKVEFDDSRIKATLYGTLINGTINISESIVHELRLPYLRKGFKTIVGFNLHANKTNL